MKTYCLVVQYDGTEYAGFQIQPNQRTIQGELEKALQRLGPNAIRIAGAGRTDAGVHSQGQTVSFRDDQLTVPVDRLPYALNSLLPKDIRVVESRLEKPDFHARISALEKTYRYQIYQSEFPNVFYQRYAYWIREPLEWDAIRECGLVCGMFGFRSFCFEREQCQEHCKNHASSDSGYRGLLETASLYGRWFSVQYGAQSSGDPC